MKTKRPVEKGNWRKRQYELSTAFEESRIVVEHDLRLSAKTHRREVETFLTWVREYGKIASKGETRKKIETFPSEVRDSLWLYVDFVLRFAHQSAARSERTVCAQGFRPVYRGEQFKARWRPC